MNGAIATMQRQIQQIPILITVPVARYPNVKHSQLGNYWANLLHLKTAPQGESTTVWYKYW